MIAAALLLLIQTTPPIVPPPVTLPTPQKPAALDWVAMPPVRYRTPPMVTPSMAAFVANEVATGRCALPRPANGHYVVTVNVALLIAGDNTVKQAVPQAINCSTVEQYAAGLATSFASSNLLPRVVPGDRWFQTAVTFDWQT